MKNIFKNKKTLILVVSAVVVIAAFAVILFFNFNKDIKTKYFAAEVKYLNSKLDEMEKLQKENDDKAEKLSQGPARTRYDFSVSLRSGEIPGLIPEAVSLINSLRVIYNSRYDKTSDKNLSTVSLLLEGQNFADINLLQDENLVGVQIPILSEMFFVSDEDKLAQALSVFGLDIPEIKVPEVTDLPVMNTVDFRSVLNSYIEYVKEEITEDNLAVTSLKDDTGKYSVYKLSFSEEEFIKFIKRTSELMLSDERFVSLTIDNMNIIIEAVNASGNADLFKQKLETIDPVKMLEMINETVDKLSFKNGFTMEVKVDSSGNIMSRNVLLSANTGDEAQRDLVFDITDDSASISVAQGDAVIEFNLSSSSDRKKLYIMTENNMWEDFTLKLDLDHQKSFDDKRKTYNHGVTAEIDFNSEILISMDLKREDRYDAPFNMPEINDTTSINLNTADPSQVDAILSELQFSALKFLLGNQSIFDIFMGDQ